MAWIVAHGGEPEADVAKTSRSGLYAIRPVRLARAPRSRRVAADPIALRDPRRAALTASTPAVQATGALAE
jgi:hypothetical protein